MSSAGQTLYTAVREGKGRAYGGYYSHDAKRGRISPAPLLEDNSRPALYSAASASLTAFTASSSIHCVHESSKFSR